MNRRRLFLGLGVCCTALAIAAALSSSYAWHVLLRRGGTRWLDVTADDAQLSEPLRVALNEPARAPHAGEPVWQPLAEGFDVGELPVLVDDVEVDRLLLARFDARRFTLHVDNDPAGSKDLDAWMRELGAVLVVNGSYYSPRGTPSTPTLSRGVFKGPRNYVGRHGALVVTDDGARIVDLEDKDWRDEFAGARDAVVSYPLLVTSTGSSRVNANGAWLANRSFIGQDVHGDIVIGTTREAYFSLEKLAAFLHDAPLDLHIALNLDGGPVACQAIAYRGFARDFCGKWETHLRDGKLQLLQPVFGAARWALPNVISVRDARDDG